MITALNFLPASGLRPASGYGKMEIALWSALADLGVTVHPVGHLWPDGIALLSATAQDGLRHSISLTTETLVIGNPEFATDYAIANESRLWLYTMSESTRLSDEWVALINLLYAGVLVPAPDLVGIYQRSGVSVPVHYVPLGLTPPPITPRPRPHPRPERFLFLTYSLGEPRKGAELTVMAFKALYGGDPRFQLWIKTPAEPAAWLRSCQDAQIALINGQLTEQAWAALLAEADCFVFPSRGEGFGLPPREATLLGTPTIATEWLGLWDVACWGLPISVHELRPAPFTGEANHPDAQWAEPDMTALQSQMRYVVECHAEARRHAERGAAYLGTFTWARCAKALLDVVGTQ